MFLDLRLEAKILRQSGRKDGGEVGEAGKNEIYEAELESRRKDCNTSQMVTILGSCNDASDGAPAGEARHHREGRAVQRNGSSHGHFWLMEESHQRTLRVIPTSAFLTALGKRLCSGCSQGIHFRSG